MDHEQHQQQQIQFRHDNWLALRRRRRARLIAKRIAAAEAALAELLQQQQVDAALALRILRATKELEAWQRARAAAVAADDAAYLQAVAAARRLAQRRHEGEQQLQSQRRLGPRP